MHILAIEKGFSFFGLYSKKTFKKQHSFPCFAQWKRIFKVLNNKEKVILLVFVVLFLGSAIFLVRHLYYNNTEVVPAFGGKYTEGVIGSPRFLNPVYASVSDVDRDLTELIFSGLMKYDDQGQIVPDLAKSYEILEEGKTYEVYLKDNLLWHDNQKLTADDIVFTIETIQNPDYKSPLRANWLGVEAKKVSETQVRFELKNPYAPFLERLTLKILPKHIWQDIPPENFPLAIFNLQPIGSGPYKFQDMQQIESGRILSLDLIKFKHYCGQTPFIPQISFLFFETEKDLINSFNRWEIQGFYLNHIQNYELINRTDFKEYSVFLPRYFALFLNTEDSDFLTNKKVRQALNHATNKQQLVQQVLKGKGQIVHSPILPALYGWQEPASYYEFNQNKAHDLLIEAGFEIENDRFIKPVKDQFTEFKSDLREGSSGAQVTALQQCLARDPEVYPEGKITGYFGPKTKQAVIKFQEKYKEEILEPWGFDQGTGTVSKTTRAKLNEVCQTPKDNLPLKFAVVTVEDPQLEATAKLIKEQWESIGIEVEVQTHSTSQLKQEIIKARDYDILLFGEVLEAIPDPFPFWHSMQKKDPGLNLAKYDNKKADKLLEEARNTLDNKERAALYEEFQDILIADCPAVFLYRPDFTYIMSSNIKGIQMQFIADPSKRFSQINNWYTNTKRAWQ